MSHAAHHAAARSVKVWVIVVSSTRTLETDESGAAVAGWIEAAGHQVLDRTVVDDDVAQISTLLRGLSGDGVTEVAILTGGTGLSRRDVTPEAVEALFTRQIPGFGELFRMLSYQEIGASAMLSRATAGMMGSLLVFALPGSPGACRLGLEKLVLPELGHLVRELGKEPATRGEAPKPTTSASTVAPPEALAASTTSVRGVSIAAAHEVAAVPAPAEPSADEVPNWRRAMVAMGGDLQRGVWVEIPEEVESIAPVVDVLHTAGERGTLKLASGRTYAVFGWPDLQAAGSKVIAIGSGSPIAELLALHRYPVPTGTCIDEGFGVLTRRTVEAATAAEAVTGRRPADSSGQLFAVLGGAVYVQRGNRAFRFDGARERDDGTLKQVLASLMLDWSTR
jgi:molybdenum cofactor biosynthesis protein B